MADLNSFSPMATPWVIELDDIYQRPKGAAQLAQRYRSA